MIQGIQGVKGTDGAIGATGAQGIQGVKGDIGNDGTDGSKGDKGDQGVQGVKGDQGIQGVKGTDGAVGATGAQGIQGVKGDIGNDGTDGSKGDKGDQGVQGVKGDQGVQGVKGTDGAVGAKGDQGVQGVKGTDGAVGATGAQGNKGDAGTASSAIMISFPQATTQLITATYTSIKFNSILGEAIINEGGIWKLGQDADIVSAAGTYIQTGSVLRAYISYGFSVDNNPNSNDKTDAANDDNIWFKLQKASSNFTDNNSWVDIPSSEIVASAASAKPYNYHANGSCIVNLQINDSIRCVIKRSTNTSSKPMKINNEFTTTSASNTAQRGGHTYLSIHDLIGGEAGPQGVKGDTGAAGAAGAKGDQGIQGIQGAKRR